MLKYLARYTHRVAINNHRLVKLEGDKVAFRYRDYADSRKEKLLMLSAEEFLRRFVQHVLPKGFMKIRHYGLLSSRRREARLRQARQLLLPKFGAASRRFNWHRTRGASVLSEVRQRAARAWRTAATRGDVPFPVRPTEHVVVRPVRRHLVIGTFSSSLQIDAAAPRPGCAPSTFLARISAPARYAKAAATPGKIVDRSPHDRLK